MVFLKNRIKKCNSYYFSMNQLNRFSSKNSQNKMNIGIVTTWFERGASQVSRQYRDLLNKKNNVFIYARGGEKYERNNPIWDTQDVTWGKKAYFQTNGTPIKRSHFKNWIDKNKIDVLFFNEQQWWIPVIWAKEWVETKERQGHLFKTKREFFAPAKLAYSQQRVVSTSQI